MFESVCYTTIQDNNICIITTHMIIWLKYYSSLIQHKWLKHKQHHVIQSHILLLNNHSIIMAITIIILIKHLRIIIIIIIIRFLTLVLASLSTPSSTRVRTVSSWPYQQALWRAVCPFYNNNEEMRHENKIKLLKWWYLEWWW